VIPARDIGPFPDRAEAIAHRRKMGASLGESSALAKMPLSFGPPARARPFADSLGTRQCRLPREGANRANTAGVH
jgi:hypothetical protein